MAHQITAVSFRRGQTNLWINLGSKWATSIMWDQKRLLALSFTNRVQIKLGVKRCFMLYYPMLYVINWRRRKATVRPRKWEIFVKRGGYGNRDAWEDFLTEVWERAVVRYEQHRTFIKIKPSKLNVNKWFTKGIRRGTRHAIWDQDIKLDSLTASDSIVGKGIDHGMPPRRPYIGRRKLWERK